MIVASALPFDPGVAQLIVAHSIIAPPFMIRNIAASLHGLDPSPQEWPDMLGATPLRAFAEIVLPVMGKGRHRLRADDRVRPVVQRIHADLFPVVGRCLPHCRSGCSRKAIRRWTPSIFAVSTIIILINIAIIIGVDHRSRGRAALVE